MSTYKTALVTGGAGFIGRHLVTLLVSKGVKVRVLDPGQDAGLPAGIEYIKGSILDEATLDKAMAGMESVYHLAALTHLWAKNKKDYERINVTGTVNVLAAAKKAGVKKLVVTSTETILRAWGEDNPFPITESDPVPDEENMAGPYTKSKLKAANLVREAAKGGQHIVQVFPTVPVGPGDVGLTAPTKMILDFVRGKTPAYFNALLNFVAVEDVALGHYLAMEKGLSGEEFILGGENHAMSRFLDILGEASGEEMPKRTVPFEIAMATAIVTEFMADFITRKPPVASKEGVRLALNPSFVSTHLAEKRLGYIPGSINPALRRTVKWFRKHDLL